MFGNLYVPKMKKGKAELKNGLSNLNLYVKPSIKFGLTSCFERYFLTQPRMNYHGGYNYQNPLPIYFT